MCVWISYFIFLLSFIRCSAVDSVQFVCNRTAYIIFMFVNNSFWELKNPKWIVFKKTKTKTKMKLKISKIFDSLCKLSRCSFPQRMEKNQRCCDWNMFWWITDKEITATKHTHSIREISNYIYKMSALMLKRMNSKCRCRIIAAASFWLFSSGIIPSLFRSHYHCNYWSWITNENPGFIRDYAWILLCEI